MGFPKECWERPACVLINNAGISRPGLTAAEWRDIVLTDLMGPGLCVQHFAERLQHCPGTVVNIASTAGLAPLARAPHYVGAKGGIIAMTKEMAIELGPRIRVNAIAPGLIATRKHRAEMRQLAETIKRMPIRRLIRPAEIARTVLFLLDRRVGITGQTIVVDGGWTAGAMAAG